MSATIKPERIGPGRYQSSCEECQDGYAGGKVAARNWAYLHNTNHHEIDTETVIREICGTVKGHSAHTKRKEKPCDPCREAQTIYAREWRHETGRSKSRLYTNDEIAEIQRQAAAQALRDASDAYPLETAYGGAEHAVNWLKQRAEHFEAPVSAGAPLFKEEA